MDSCSFSAINPRDPNDQAKCRPEFTLTETLDRQVCASVIRVLGEFGLRTEGKHYRMKYGGDTVTYITITSLDLDQGIDLIAAVRRTCEQLQGRS